LHVAIDPKDELHRWYLARRKEAVERARGAIRQGLDLGKLPQEDLQSGVGKMLDQLGEVLTLLGSPSDAEVEEIARKLEGKA